MSGSISPGTYCPPNGVRKMTLLLVVASAAYLVLAVKMYLSYRPYQVLGGVVVGGFCALICYGGMLQPNRDVAVLVANIAATVVTLFGFWLCPNDPPTAPSPILGWTLTLWRLPQPWQGGKPRHETNWINGVRTHNGITFRRSDTRDECTVSKPVVKLRIVLKAHPWDYGPWRFHYLCRQVMRIVKNDSLETLGLDTTVGQIIDSVAQTIAGCGRLDYTITEVN